LGSFSLIVIGDFNSRPKSKPIDDLKLIDLICKSEEEVVSEERICDKDTVIDPGTTTAKNRFDYIFGST